MGQARDAVERLMAVYDRKDPAALLDLYAADAKITRPGGGMMSRDGLPGFFTTFVQALPDFTHHLSAIIEEADTAAYEAVVTGTFTGSLLTPGGLVPPTGRGLRLPEAGFVTVNRDGMIISDVSYLDQVDMLTQLGLMPPQAASG